MLNRWKCLSTPGKKHICYLLRWKKRHPLVKKYVSKGHALVEQSAFWGSGLAGVQVEFATYHYAWDNIYVRS